jgi:hypothetical protein
VQQHTGKKPANCHIRDLLEKSLPTGRGPAIPRQAPPDGSYRHYPSPQHRTSKCYWLDEGGAGIVQALEGNSCQPARGVKPINTFTPPQPGHQTPGTGLGPAHGVAAVAVPPRRHPLPATMRPGRRTQESCADNALHIGRHAAPHPQLRNQCCPRPPPSPASVSPGQHQLRRRGHYLATATAQKGPIMAAGPWGGAATSR